MNRTTAVLLVTAFGTTSCVSVDLSETCNYAQEKPFYQYKPAALTFVVGYPSRSDGGSPYLLLDGIDSEPGLTVKLVRKDDSYGLPAKVKFRHCENIEFRAFGLEVDTNDWDAYWTASKENGGFSFGIAFPGLEPPVPAKSMGFAFIDNQTGDWAASCGCLAR